MNVRAFLLDVEGTTTPISFVHDVLFSYARLHLKDYLLNHRDDPQLARDLELLRHEHREELDEQPAPLVEPYLHWLIERDRKSPALKSIQGKIWELGYLDGTLRSLVFDDVRPAMERWQGRGISVSIFSSGSVLAQKLLFAHTNHGDLTPLISSYFDTEIGKKAEPTSYQRIASKLALPVNEIHFVSDVVAELDAAARSGMCTSLCVRPGNAQLQSVPSHRIVHSFVELQ